jgi:hypothetical protein
VILALVAEAPVVEGPAALGAVLALVLVLWSVAWTLARYIMTVVHEGGHAIVGILFGRGLDGVRIHPDSGGWTKVGELTPTFGTLAILLAGYSAPSLFGLGAAALVDAERYPLLLLLAAGLLAGGLFLIRGVFTWFVVLTLSALIGWVLLEAEPDVRSGVASSLAWLLLFGGVRDVHDLPRPRRGGSSDADQLARLTHVPGLLWVGLFWVVAVGALILGAGMLLGPD